MSDICVTRGNVTVSILVQYCGAERWILDFSRKTVRPYFLITLIPSFTDSVTVTDLVNLRRTLFK